jgi:hypothetical protein
VGPAFYKVDLRVTKAFYIRRESGVKIEISAQGMNLFNHTNFIAVNNVFAVGDPFLTTGPFNLTGNKMLPPTQPLGFTAAANPREFQFGLRFAF